MAMSPDMLRSLGQTPADLKQAPTERPLEFRLEALPSTFNMIQTAISYCQPVN